MRTSTRQSKARRRPREYRYRDHTSMWRDISEATRETAYPSTRSRYNLGPREFLTARVPIVGRFASTRDRRGEACQDTPFADDEEHKQQLNVMNDPLHAMSDVSPLNELESRCLKRSLRFESQLRRVDDEITRLVTTSRANRERVAKLSQATKKGMSRGRRPLTRDRDRETMSNDQPPRQSMRPANHTPIGRRLRDRCTMKNNAHSENSDRRDDAPVVAPDGSVLVVAPLERMPMTLPPSGQSTLKRMIGANTARVDTLFPETIPRRGGRSQRNFGQSASFRSVVERRKRDEAI